MLVDLRLFRTLEGLFEALASFEIRCMVSMAVGTLGLLSLNSTGCKPVVSSTSKTGGRSLFTLIKVMTKLLALKALKDSWERLIFHYFETLTVDAETVSNEVILLCL